MAVTVVGQSALVGPSQTTSATTTTGANRLRGADVVGRSNRRKIRSLRASSAEAVRSLATLDTKIVGIKRARECFFHVVVVCSGSALEPGYPWRVERVVEEKEEKVGERCGARLLCGHIVPHCVEEPSVGGSSFLS